MFKTGNVHLAFELQPIENEGFHAIIQARINGLPARLLIDTGASRSVFDTNRFGRFVHGHEFKPDEKLSAGLGTSSMQTMEVTLDELGLGEIVLKRLDTILLDMSHVNGSYERLGLPQLDGVIGSDLLERLGAIVDYRKRRISFLKDPR
jgi:predicted aspartyl protease